jgi:hypothetical protein
VSKQTNKQTAEQLGKYPLLSLVKTSARPVTPLVLLARENRNMIKAERETQRDRPRETKRETEREVRQTHIHTERERDTEATSEMLCKVPRGTHRDGGLRLGARALVAGVSPRPVDVRALQRTDTQEHRTQEQRRAERRQEHRAEQSRAEQSRAEQSRESEESVQCKQT